MAGSVVIFLETAGQQLKKSAFELATVGRELADQLDSEVVAVVFGDGLEESLSQLGEYGVDKVHYVAGAELVDYNVHYYAPIMTEWLQQQKPQVVLAIASLLGKDLLPRIAARLGVGMASDCTQIRYSDGKLHLQRPVYAGKAFVDMTFVGKSPHIATLRPNVFAAKKQGAVEVSIDKQSFQVPAQVGGKLMEVQQAKSERADLTEADIIVSGGRSLKNSENFKILEELADVIGATVGASRAAVDAGYVPHSMQVGQTGKTVSPKLYLAFGISGAIQHLAGMRTSKVIVAVNSDAEAPIFKKADYGVVGDLFVLVPEITKAFKELLDGG